MLNPSSNRTPHAVCVFNLIARTTAADYKPYLDQLRMFKSQRETTVVDIPTETARKKGGKGPEESAIPSIDFIDINQQTHAEAGGQEESFLLVRAIEQRYDQYVGFVILHHVDAIVDTACALAFALENLGKPVAFTGSIIGLEYAHSDMQRNFLLSVLFAGQLATDCAEVVIVFSETVFRAVRTHQASSNRWLPFSSLHRPPIASLQGKLIKGLPYKQRDLLTDAIIPHKNERKVRVLRLTVTPSMSADVTEHLVAQSSADALVIVAFGAGNVNAAVASAAQLAVRLSMIVCVCTQVRGATVTLGMYEASGGLPKEAVDCGDMTVEATVAKVKYLIGLGLTNERVRKLMVQDLRGEITEAPQKSRL